MVDEALKSYLTTQVPRCKGALEDLFSNKATLKEVKPDTREALIAAIGRVKILDPACGSGAFPMGALHRLVDLLQKLDPNNESWKRDRLAEARRYRQLLEESGAAKEEIAACDARIADIEKSFDSRFHALDFARKLYLIENSIYGVDIQPIATQIAKLRFFISLVVDQKVNVKADNLGVRPLPNLETRLVAADTLIPIEKTESDLLTGELDKLRAELAAIRHEHFNARSPAAKRKWRDADETKRSEIAYLLESNHALPRASARKLAAWDPYDQNEFARFFDSEWMFGLPIGKVRIQGKAPATLLGNLALINEAGGQSELTATTSKEIDSGFDIVIGNPPYIRLQTLKQKDPSIPAFYRQHYASAAKGNYDIYVVFIEAGLQLLKSDGHLAYICPHKFFNAKYGEPLRGLVASGKKLQHVVHFGDEQVFPGATIYTCLLFLANKGSEEVSFISASDFSAWRESCAGIVGKFAANSLTSHEWNFAVGKGGQVFRELMAHPQKLLHVAPRIFQGPITSADGVFLFKDCEAIDSSSTVVTVTSKQLGTDVKIERNILKRVVRSGDIGCNSARATALVLFPYEVIDNSARLFGQTEFKKKWPLAWGYLLKNQSLLRARENGAFDDSKWYRFGRTQNLGMWEQPKLLIPYMITQLAAYFDQSDHFYFINVTTGGYGAIANERLCSLPSLCALLNSSVLDFCLKRVSSNFQGGYFPANKQFVEQLPIKTPDENESVLLENMTHLITAYKKWWLRSDKVTTTRDPLMLSYWERVLNGLVYELYFPEEVHGAGLQLFDLVEQAKIPAIVSVKEADRLPKLRKLFEKLYDGAHPLRIALDKLQTLETVRIIEGKA